MTTAKHTEYFTVRGYAVNTRKELRIPTLVRYMHETAMQHVLNLGLSVLDLEPRNLAWILTRIQVRVHALPRLGQQIRIVTHPSGFEKIRTFRDYRVYDEAGTLLADAVSTWYLMDTRSRRLARVPAEIRGQIEGILEQIDDTLPRQKAQMPASDEIHYQRQFQVGWHDLDFNGHLNNIHYIKWMLDALPGSFFASHRLKTLDIYYKQECVIDDLVSSEVQLRESEHITSHRLHLHGKEVALAICTWGAV